MIDYDATLTKFFDQIMVFLHNNALRANDAQDYECILKNMDIVETIKDNPRKYADYSVRIQAHVVEDAEAFMRGGDNSVFLIYSKVMWCLNDFYSKYDYKRREAQKVLENALKSLMYINSKNIFKDLYFPFVPANRFTVQQKIK